MSRYRPYLMYKNSGVAWLGKVPKHWDVKRFKFAVAFTKNGVWGDDPNGVDDIKCVRVADFDRGALRVAADVPTFRAVPLNERKLRLLRRGDLLLEKSGGGENQPVGQVVIYDQDGDAVCSNFVSKMELVAGAYPPFFNYLFAAAYFVRLNMRSVKQTSGIQNLDQEQYLSEFGVFPPIAEQTAIAAALDRETARIDALIEKKTRFVELLKEKRQAVITHAVTKGLDPNVKMKDSGVEWLGKVPAHWEVKRLRHFASLNPSPDWQTLEQLAECAFFPMEAIGETGELDRSRRKPLNECRTGYTYFAEGDVTYAKVTPCFENGKGAVMCGLDGGHGFGTTELTVLRPTAIDRDYLFAMTSAESFRRPAAAEMLGSGGLKRVPDDFARNYQAAIPPAPEQAAIVAALDRETARIDTLISATEHSITLLKERRSTLITAAVTGQIDLREAS